MPMAVKVTDAGHMPVRGSIDDILLPDSSKYRVPHPAQTA